MRWEEYLELFVKEPRSFEIMNETAPGFFRSVQDLYWESILLGLCRFADKRTVSGRRTLSLDTLLSFSNAQAVPRIAELVDCARQMTKFAQDWRNRHIAHADLQHALDKDVTPLAPASRIHVRGALAAIVDVLSSVEMYFTGAGLGFLGTDIGFGGQYLLNQLRAASRLQKEHWNRIKSGNMREEDNDWPKWRGTL